MIEGFISIRFLDIIDILLVALLLYELYNLIKGTAAINIFLGIVSIFLLWQLVQVLEMELLSEILGAFISVGFIALIVVFQPEIRKFLLLVGTPTFLSKRRKRFFFWRFNVSNGPVLDIDPLVKACHKMSANRIGALIVIANQNELEEYIESGVPLDAQISEQLIESTFYPNSPLHDGAMIITNNRVKTARSILPVSKKTELPAFIGLRHRAAVGITERSDAIAIVVSEQTGKISYSKSGSLKLDLSAAELKNVLEEEFNPS
ncbi:MAG TPA: TIGR00159 family protein [Bacteroidales bacterium]|nr:TIGR00159 family protein [Bacteroidales bacterium]